MPRGRPNTEEGADPRTNKMEAVRQAMDRLGYDASPLEIQKFIKDNFEQEMSANMISSYKSTLRGKKGLAGRRKKRGRPKGAAAAASPAAAAVPSHDVVLLKDIRTLKDIAGRLGKKGFRELMELLD